MKRVAADDHLDLFEPAKRPDDTRLLPAEGDAMTQLASSAQLIFAPLWIFAPTFEKIIDFIIVHWIVRTRRNAPRCRQMEPKFQNFWGENPQNPLGLAPLALAQMHSASELLCPHWFLAHANFALSKPLAWTEFFSPCASTRYYFTLERTGTRILDETGGERWWGLHPMGIPSEIGTLATPTNFLA